MRACGFSNSGEKDVRFKRKNWQPRWGLGATAPELTAYVMYGLGLALSHTYSAYLRIPISINLFLSPACGRS